MKLIDSVGASKLELLYPIVKDIEISSKSTLRCHYLTVVTGHQQIVADGIAASLLDALLTTGGVVDLSHFTDVSIHAPSKLTTLSERVAGVRNHRVDLASVLDDNEHQVDVGLRGNGSRKGYRRASRTVGVYVHMPVSPLSKSVPGGALVYMKSCWVGAPPLWN